MCVQFRMEPGQVVQETYTVEEDPQESPPVVSVEVGEDGTTRRTETTVTRADGMQFEVYTITGEVFQSLDHVYILLLFLNLHSPARRGHTCLLPFSIPVCPTALSQSSHLLCRDPGGLHLMKIMSSPCFTLHP